MTNYLNLYMKLIMNRLFQSYVLVTLQDKYIDLELKCNIFSLVIYENIRSQQNIGRNFDANIYKNL